MPQINESISGRTSSRRYGEVGNYERSFTLTYDDPPTSVTQIENDLGITMGMPHPENDGAIVIGIDVDPLDDSGLLWRVRLSYGEKPADKDDPEPGEPPGEGEPTPPPVIRRQPLWSASSSTTSVPCFQHYTNGNGGLETITNSAGDPLEGLDCEAAEFRISLTQYYHSHEQWMTTAVNYTNAVNSDTWHGKAPGTWKCQGCSAQIETAGGVVFWAVTFEFAYRDTWNLTPWDVGYNERVGDDGVPSMTGTKRRGIVGQDRKPTKHPVALGGGVALPAGTKPNVINNGLGVRVYREMPFFYFGQIYTPGVANT